MLEFGGLWKHGNKQHALVPPKTECGCPSDGGIKNGHVLLWRNATKINKQTKTMEKHVIQSDNCEGVKHVGVGIEACVGGCM